MVFHVRVFENRPDDVHTLPKPLDRAGEFQAVFREAKPPTVIEPQQQDEPTRDEAYLAAPASVEELSHVAASRPQPIGAVAPQSERENSLDSFWGWVEASAAAIADWLDEVNATWIEVSP